MSATPASRQGPVFVNPTEQEPPVVDTKEVEAKQKRYEADVAREKALTEEELEAQREEFAAIALGRSRPPKKESKDKAVQKGEPKPVEDGATLDPAKKAAEDEAKAKQATADKAKEEEDPEPPKPAKGKRKVAEPAAAPSVDAAISHAVREAVQPIVDQLKPKPAPEPDSGLTARQQKILDAARHLEATQPERKGLTVKTLAGFRAENDYRKKWEAANPGERWNADAEEHNAFYEKHQPTLDDEEYETAMESLVEERAIKKAKEESNKELAAFKREQEFTTVKPQIQHEANVAMLDFIPQAVPAFAEMMGLKLVKGEDGKEKWEGDPKLTKEIVDKMKEADPEVFEIMDVEGEKMRIAMQELDLFARFPDKHKMSTLVTLGTNGKRFNPQDHVEAFVTGLEQELAALPKEETDKDGKQFLTIAQWGKKLESIKTKEDYDEFESRFWCLTPPIIKRSMLEDSAANVAEQIKKFESRVQRLTSKANGETSEQKAERERIAKEKAEQEQQAVTQSRVKPPNTAISSDKVDTTQKGKNPSGISDEIWALKA